MLNKVIIVTILLLSTASVAQASGITRDKAILAIIGEGEGEPYQGKLALAYAIINRGTLKGVYGLHAPRVIKHKYSDKVYADCAKAWDYAVSHPTSDITKGASHWEGTAFKTPYWARNAVVTLTVGHQRFYSLPEDV